MSVVKNSAVIGYTGFVGSTLLKQVKFENFYRSTNIDQIVGQSFDTVVCAGAPSKKWVANAEPEADLEQIKVLIKALKKINCNNLILISTVDVFKAPIGVDEDTKINIEGLHAYGLHRRLLEQFVESQFDNHLIVRLPGLVGPGLRKNIIYDFLNNNNVNMLDSRSIYQFYPMVNLWSDIQIALANKLKLVHLTAKPVSVSDIAKQCFGLDFKHTLTVPPSYYDVHSIHDILYGGYNGYQYSYKETLLAIRAYAQSEVKTAKERK